MYITTSCSWWWWWSCWVVCVTLCPSQPNTTVPLHHFHFLNRSPPTSLSFSRAALPSPHHLYMSSCDPFTRKTEAIH
ncbi:uncharacterized protein LY79DRAFT_560170 [Colletotrichum navitas]|uniref:Secreted protein n=1 Tax=Colletotrichum navitas TaxID=681940 RepID=A0AAD8PU96_9PEZI|nr:uncharacterized protein LY79DRAFT_560170 [Colletotrichum navitas]KAK1584837.1 hypothetical protein LY79DRAFT_560170 [Colletotrichum navitas]